MAKIDTNTYRSNPHVRHSLSHAMWDKDDIRCAARRASAWMRWHVAKMRGRVRRAFTYAEWRFEDFRRGAREAFAATTERRKPPYAAMALGIGLVAAMIWTGPAPRGGPEGAVVAAKAPFAAKKQGAALTAAVQRKSRVKPRGVVLVSASAHALYKDFRKIGYRLEDVRRGDGAVPRVFVKAMPQDIGEVSSITKRKAVFIKTMLPLVLRTNEELRAIRAKVLALTERESKGQPIAPVERAWLAAQYDRFGVARNDREGLLLRVDVIPPSLAVAQGAEESGWGSSRFALEGRALFGQRTHSKAGGLVPEDRAAGADFKIKSFGHLLEGVRSYAHNLNTHPAYAGFRALRARMRAKAGGPHGLDAYRLVNALKRYSERGADYLKTIKTIIRVNNLRALDGARLSQALGGAEKLNPA